MITRRLDDPESAFMSALSSTAALCPQGALRVMLITEYRQRVKDRLITLEISETIATSYRDQLAQYGITD